MFIVRGESVLRWNLFATAGGLDRVNQQECQIALTLVDPEIPTKVL